MDTNLPPMEASNPPVVVPPVATNTVVAPPVAPVEPLAPAVGSDYVVAKGDSLAKIAKKNGVGLKALEAANPGVVPTKLKIGQKITIPAGGKTADVGTTMGATADSGATYSVKSGDTLSKIAKSHGTTVKQLEAANNLTTTKIKVGEKLKIPAKAETAAPAPVVDNAQGTPPVSVPTTTSAPAPTH
jgi:LysM repeat protein